MRALSKKVITQLSQAQTDVDDDDFETGTGTFQKTKRRERQAFVVLPTESDDGHLQRMLSEQHDKSLLSANNITTVIKPYRQQYEYHDGSPMMMVTQNDHPSQQLFAVMNTETDSSANEC